MVDSCPRLQEVKSADSLIHPGVLSSGVSHYTLLVLWHLLQNQEWGHSVVTGSLRKGTTNRRLFVLSNGNTLRLTQESSTRGNCVPPRIFNTVRRQFGVTVGMGDTTWHLEGRCQGCCKYATMHTDQPIQQKNYLALNGKTLGFEKPCPMPMQGMC